jgi:hypothetical protein
MSVVIHAVIVHMYFTTEAALVYNTLHKYILSFLSKSTTWKAGVTILYATVHSTIKHVSLCLHNKYYTNNTSKTLFNNTV